MPLDETENGGNPGASLSDYSVKVICDNFVKLPDKKISCRTDFAFVRQEVSYASGSLSGVPAFLGYLPGVFFTFSIMTRERPISDPGRSKY